MCQNGPRMNFPNSKWIVRKKQVLCCDIEQAKVLWSKDFDWVAPSTLSAARGKVYFFDQEGKATVIKASREYQAIAVNRLEDGFMASPAVSGGALFLRTKSALYRIEDRSRK